MPKSNDTGAPEAGASGGCGIIAAVQRERNDSSAVAWRLAAIIALLTATIATGALRPLANNDSRRHHDRISCCL